MGKPMYQAQIVSSSVPMFKKVLLFKRRLIGRFHRYELITTCEGVTQEDAKDLVRRLRAGEYTEEYKGVKNHETPPNIQELKKEEPPCENQTGPSPLPIPSV